MPTSLRIAALSLSLAMTASQLEFSSPLWPAPPRFEAGHDLTVQDGDVMRLGDAQLLLPITPGHTMGTVSPILEVKAGSRTHRAVIWGGTGFNFGRDLPRLDAYIASTERMKQLVVQHGVDVLLSNHPSYDGTADKLPKLREPRPEGAPHPYVLGTLTVLRAMTVAGECARANKLRFERQP